ncbi:lipid IV(A) palmitoyltransferase PagP [Bordetella genomosp. 11]|uniref:Lipid A acyltransferase PagP n=1 Tax=Bordetella genomosp. 11 TaxID=1416808 RepID=A0A261UJS7_9BORD|nr:lipid IV(A) palmitoyltransferase PagP [Bordetella genomosp. 11]OZI62166.1 phospholipid:lipid A palmitoyltransferase [Bordetella genomosp. 11]
MKRSFVRAARRASATALLTASAALPFTAHACDNVPDWAQSACARLDQIWNQGSDELYLSGYAWHNRAAYSADKIKSFREESWGGGWGKGIYDEDGDWQGLYGMAFLDSHGHVEPIAGYGYQKIGRVGQNWRFGIGYTAFLTARQDIFHYIPFPGILPLASVGYDKATFYATYIPGGKGNGNVLFMFGKWTF